MRARPHLPPRAATARWHWPAVGAGAGAGLLAVLALLIGTAMIWRGGEVRCYYLDPPINFAERQLLAGKPTECVITQCRVVVRLGSASGLACFYPQALIAP